MVYNAQKVALTINYQDGVYLVLLHNLLDFCYLGLGTDGFRATRHDVTNGMVEEVGLPSLYGAADIAIGNDTCDVTVDFGYAKTKLTLADHHDGLTQIQQGRENWQVGGAHHIGSSGQQPFSKLAARVEMGKILGAEVTLLHQRYGKGITHGQCGRG